MKLFGMILLVGSLVIGVSPVNAADDNAADNTANEEIDRLLDDLLKMDVAEDTATHREIEPLSIEFKRLTALQLDPAGNLLACDGDDRQIKVIDPDGNVTATMALDFGPEALDVGPDGTIYCGGQGQLAVLDKQGKILRTATVPDVEVPDESARRRPRSSGNRVSGLAVSGDDLFVAIGSGWSRGSKSKLFRFTLALEEPELLIEGLQGCCQRCDITSKDGVLYLAENSAHRVVTVDRQGERLSKWGERSRNAVEGFGSCCNPMNLAFDAEGMLYTAESGIGRVKRYTTDGKYLGLVGYLGVARFTSAGGLASSCSNVAIAATPDGRRVYAMDYKNNIIRVLQQKD
ncbi:MAG: hypothetical protein V3R99_01710 [Thermoguttaceae bacterium]